MASCSLEQEQEFTELPSLSEFQRTACYDERCVRYEECARMMKDSRATESGM